MKFSGFPRGVQYTPVPNSLFGPLLEAIDDTAELKCTLRAIWLLHRLKGFPRYVTAGQILADRVLILGLKDTGVPSQNAIHQGMKNAVDRGTFLTLSVRTDGNQEEFYFLNDEPGRRGLAITRESPGAINEASISEIALGEPIEEKNNIYSIYEQNIGILTPLLSEEMMEAESIYPWPWIKEAFKLAVSHNKRSWRYIEATLSRWSTEGKNDGEPRRYPQKAPSMEGLAEYLRKRGRLPAPRRR